MKNEPLNVYRYDAEFQLWNRIEVASYRETKQGDIWKDTFESKKQWHVRFHVTIDGFQTLKEAQQISISFNRLDEKGA